MRTTSHTSPFRLDAHRILKDDGNQYQFKHTAHIQAHTHKAQQLAML